MFNDLFEFKVRKNNIEGLQESYFGESVNVALDLDEFRKLIAIQLIEDAKNTWDDLTFHDEDEHGQLSYSKIITYLSHGNEEVARLDKQCKEALKIDILPALKDGDS